MTELTKGGPSRRSLLASGLALPLAPALLRQAWAQGHATTTVHGFETGADVAAAEKEGEILFYTHDSDPAAAALMKAFSTDFPKIKGNYLRAQTGALYSKLLAERSAGRFAADVIQFSEVPTAMDFRKRDGFELYVSPQAKAYPETALDNPPGYFFHSGVLPIGIAYNTDRVPEAEAPKSWKDLLDPKWRGTISTKQVTSGSQFVQWYELRRLYGDGFWKDFAKQRPRGFDSRAQIFDRLAKGDDKICGMAEWAGYQLAKDKGAPVRFVVPEDGAPTATLATGLATKAPHPQAARLFLDWLMSQRGQAVYQNNPFYYYPSLRRDAPPMPGGANLREYKLLFPDIEKLAQSHSAFVKEWNGMMGL
ncbi:extracellular solute-binding protein [Methylobacterium sp. J-067]|nr:extracellular solute-binding protein [Methylobacterium sp. J-067]